jgi:hypothetical protein
LDLDGTFIPNQEVKLKLSSDIIPDETKFMALNHVRIHSNIVSWGQMGTSMGQKSFFSKELIRSFVKKFEVKKMGENMS